MLTSCLFVTRTCSCVVYYNVELHALAAGIIVNHLAI